MPKKKATSKPKRTARQQAGGCRRPSFCSGLAARWSDAQIESADKIVNDIAEDIDCGQSRAMHRRAIAILADRLYEAHAARTSALHEILLLLLERMNEPSPNKQITH